ncbi:arginase family protein [Hymenobacter qilianensis]|uniref:arginase family protein n=1 Tax=Hymenobacter qilianensis TaxID=1385715 RepID=UPI00293BFF35|nr:arginase family protein [Hymenobacter qilianensis]
MPFTVEEAQVIVVPVPWEVTVSYRAGTALGPAAIREASLQVDLYDPDIADAWRLGLAMEEEDESWAAESRELREQTSGYIRWLEDGQPAEKAPSMLRLLVRLLFGAKHCWSGSSKKPVLTSMPARR